MSDASNTTQTEEVPLVPVPKRLSIFVSITVILLSTITSGCAIKKIRKSSTT